MRSWTPEGDSTGDTNHYFFPYSYCYCCCCSFYCYYFCYPYYCYYNVWLDAHTPTASLRKASNTCGQQVLQVLFSA